MKRYWNFVLKFHSHAKVNVTLKRNNVVRLYIAHAFTQTKPRFLVKTNKHVSQRINLVAFEAFTPCSLINHPKLSASLREYEQIAGCFKVIGHIA